MVRGDFLCIPAQSLFYCNMDACNANVLFFAENGFYFANRQFLNISPPRRHLIIPVIDLFGYRCCRPSRLPMRLSSSFVMLPESFATIGASICPPPSYPISVAVMPTSTSAISVTSTAS